MEMLVKPEENPATEEKPSFVGCQITEKGGKVGVGSRGKPARWQVQLESHGLTNLRG